MAIRLNKTKVLKLAQRYKEIAAQEAVLKKEKEKISQELKNIMKDQDLQELLIDAYKITFCQYAVERFDSKLFKEKKADLYQKFVNTSIQEKLNVNLGK